MRVFIGLGSNLKNPQWQIKTAINEIRSLPDSAFVASSSLYRSQPLGPQKQPYYINAVVEIDTRLTPHDLLDEIQHIELRHGRVRHHHWGARTLDLDLLLYGQEIIKDKRLIIPHSGIAKREFVLYPLREVDKNLVVPKLGSVEQLIMECPLDRLEQLERTE